MSFFPRRNSRPLTLGGVPIGAGAPISIQSMTNTPTADVEATAAQIAQLAEAGCQIVRLAVPGQEAADALPRLVARSPVPLVADIHFDHRLALAALEAGVQGLRLNPGNIGAQERVRQVARAAKAAGAPIRIGVNAGSLEERFVTQYGRTAQAMAASALSHIALLEAEDFREIKVSLKSSDIPMTIEAYRLLAQQVDYPFHIGLTEAGTLKRGSIRSACALSVLLAEGLGDTVRVSLTGDPLEEVWAAQEILGALGLYQTNFQFISCPTCGRTMIDVEQIALEVEERLRGVKPPRPLKIAVMGCVVNGPGEAQDADVAIAGGQGEGLLFYQGQAVGKYANDDLAPALIALIQKIINQQPINQ